MTKQELVSTIAEETGESKEAVKASIDVVIEGISSALADGEIVELHPLGRFIPVEEPEHQGTNPQDPSEAITIPAKVRVLFHPAQALKTLVNEGDEESPEEE